MPCNKKRKAPALDKGEEPGLYYEQKSYRGLSGWPLVFLKMVTVRSAPWRLLLFEDLNDQTNDADNY